MLLVACGGGEEPANQAASAPFENAAAPELGKEAAGSNVSDNALPPAEPDEALVPPAFRGSWAESQAACDARGHVSRLVIAGDSLRFHESVLQVARVERIGPREINIIGTATGEGTTRPAEYHYLLDPAGDTLTDGAGGGMVRRRCP